MTNSLLLLSCVDAVKLSRVFKAQDSEARGLSEHEVDESSLLQYSESSIEIISA